MFARSGIRSHGSQVVKDTYNTIPPPPVFVRLSSRPPGVQFHGGGPPIRIFFPCWISTGSGLLKILIRHFDVLFYFLTLDWIIRLKSCNLTNQFVVSIQKFILILNFLFWMENTIRNLIGYFHSKFQLDV